MAWCCLNCLALQIFGVFFFFFFFFFVILGHYIIEAKLESRNYHFIAPAQCILVLCDLVVDQTLTEYMFTITLKYYFMLKDSFDSIHCLICYKTFKKSRKYVLKRHLLRYHFKGHYYKLPLNLGLVKGTFS